jgi:hypothetical protein
MCPTVQKDNEIFSTKAVVLQDMMDHHKNCPKVVKYIIDWRSLCKSREYLNQADSKNTDIREHLRTAEPFPIFSRSNAGTMLLQIQSLIRQTQSDDGRLTTERPNLQVHCSISAPAVL